MVNGTGVSPVDKVVDRPVERWGKLGASLGRKRWRMWISVSRVSPEAAEKRR
ncbi:hypothetical protein GCM10027076_21330 [Nocardioides montaniterrae]